MSEPNTTAANRRAAQRRVPKAGVKVTCQRGTMGLGPNLTLAVLDVSETGMRLSLKSSLAKGQAVEITLNVPGLVKPINLPAVVVRAASEPNGTGLAGVRFQRPLSYRDLLQATVLGD